MAVSVERSTMLAFLGIVVLGGVNGTAIRIGSEELAPFWAASLRFALAGVIFLGIVAVRRVPFPRGWALVGSLLYGLLGLGVPFALVYWALATVPAGIAQVVLALVPLLTLLLAVAVGIEHFRIQGVVGALITIGGAVVVFSERLGSAVRLESLLALLGAASAMALGNVVIKRFPHSHPLSNNTVAMGVGALMLFGLALIASESLALPARVSTLLGLAYLVVVGSVVVFTLYLVVIDRWTASATSYSLLLMPLVAIVVAAALLGEPITAALIVGGALVLAGVYVGAFSPSLRRPLPALFGRQVPATATATSGPPTLQTPNCP
ncbi:MAG: DMT family transporter [Candidatus Limnocylindrales bacterium]